MDIPEHLLHYIWQFRLFNQLNLNCDDGQELSIISTGQINQDAGPDFQFAHLLIGNRHWFGHVEIHVNAADWENHKHHTNKDYNTVILHVFWSNP